MLPIVVLFATWIGFFNVGASTGHWKITDWFLHFAMRSAVRTYALAVDVPDRLPEEGLQPAAAHFVRGCAICHGAPGEPRSPAALAMLPQPPDLSAVVDTWDDAELFRIVKHGVRFTGMPAWPTQARDDEVWAMVVFLRALPAMDPGRYRVLAYGGNAAAPAHALRYDEGVAECVRCHGSDGKGRSALTPVLAGQKETYLLESLRAYASGQRPSGVMQVATQAVDPAQFPALARHFAALPRSDETGKDESGRARAGEQIARSGRPADKIPACLGCHANEGRNPNYPLLTGQPASYISAQLHLFREGKRGGGRFGHLMEEAVKDLSDDDIESVAEYFSGFGSQD
ncbi:c-type cytochrome [Ensifer sp. NPDC090286]|uniref:c-type cytochrome n=1 Tax=Ensifer sp. NPDC090286 TaxID=3363991 RepID=UPI00383AB059